MKRDFTYIDDLVDGIKYLVDAVPCINNDLQAKTLKADSKSPVAPLELST